MRCEQSEFCHRILLCEPAPPGPRRAGAGRTLPSGRESALGVLFLVRLGRTHLVLIHLGRCWAWSRGRLSASRRRGCGGVRGLACCARHRGRPWRDGRGHRGVASLTFLPIALVIPLESLLFANRLAAFVQLSLLFGLFFVRLPCSFALAALPRGA